ncbi:hypothetical protein PT974_08644 [Cladobotryum mycophilum]|uniref:Cytoskeleton-associated protein n=1 Tax=Cladobotryum mycophilum TaxID=491253 RepID=A0ABR0SEV4_9HYPO
MITVLTLIRDENEIPPTEPKTQYITQDTEDALQLDTLEKLLDHPNYSIREIAIKILCDRAVNDEDTTMYLLYGITRTDYDERMKCLRALALLTGQTIGLEGLSKLNDPKAYSALVRSLELSLDDVERPDLSNNHWDEYYLRDMAERFCLMFILELVNKYGANRLIKAKFVEKWLAKQAWGHAPEERRRNFKSYMDLKNNRIVDIVNRIKHCRRGILALEETGLIDKGSSSGRQRMQELEELPELPGLPGLIMDMNDDLGDEPVEHQARRTREHSAEEQRLRRQHREAMVLNDGTRPLGREDIIEREHSSPP